MTDPNKRNILYFESTSMSGLHKEMEAWQNENDKRYLSMSIEKDGDTYCCIALTNPTEVVITNRRGDQTVGLAGSRLMVISR